MSKFDYRAFITYSNADTKAAAWLQKSLESFRVPSRLVGKETAGGVISRRIGKLFRDREELTAGDDLSERLNEALATSEFLIVVCSPAARKSRWVDLEIREFKKTHSDSKILCIIVDGEPFTGDTPDLEHLECFPRALEYLACDSGEAVAREPIAADLRNGGDGKRLVKLKLVSGFLAIKLDELIQRDGHRRQRNLLIATLASAVGMLAFAFISFLAIEARNSEELRRAEAEDLIEFMLSDLRERLDAVGRLDVLDAVGKKAVEYYSNVDIAEHSESSLGRRARAFLLLGEVDDLLGNLDSARSAFDEAFQSTAELLARSPDDGEQIYNHAQSLFWVGYLEWRLGNHSNAVTSFQMYQSMADQLTQLDPDNVDWVIESGSASLNLGVYTLETGSALDAIPFFEKARMVYEHAMALAPDNIEISWLVAQSNAYLADANLSARNLDIARDYRSREILMYDEILARDPNNQDINLSLLTSHQARGRIFMQLGAVSDAVQDSRRAQEVGEELLAIDPENTLVIFELAGAYFRLAESLYFADPSRESISLIERAENMVLRLIERDENVLEWNMLYYSIQIQKNVLGVDANDSDVKIANLNRLQEEVNMLDVASSEVLEVQEFAPLIHFYLGQAYSAADRNDEAARQMQMVVENLIATKDEQSPRMIAILSLASSFIGDDELSAELAAELEAINYSHPGFL